MQQAASGLDMLTLHEIHQTHPGALAFLMMRRDGPANLVRRPALDCYLLGIGLSISTIRIQAGGRTVRRGTYGLHGVHLIQPHQQADYGFTGRLVNFRLRLSTDAVAAAIEEAGAAPAFAELRDMPEQSDAKLGALSRRIARESLSEHPDQMLIDTLMQLLVDRIVALNLSRKVRPKWRETLRPDVLARVLDYITSACDRTITLAELTTLAGLSRPHFIRAFKGATGAPPHAFITMVRLRRAGELLGSKLTLAEIAAAAGFCHQAHMASTFARWIGFAPSELRHPARFGFARHLALMLP
jgi:AraC family transcriptional regulator